MDESIDANKLLRGDIKIFYCDCLKCDSDIEDKVQFDGLCLACHNKALKTKKDGE